MSTYTDLHNKVKEAINVDYHDRITTQKARFLNEENEYWGTFKGKLNVASAVVTKSTVVDSVLSDVVLTGSILIGEYDLPGFAAKLRELSGTIENQSELLDGEIAEREENEKNISILITNQDAKTTAEISTIKDNIVFLSSKIDTQSSDIKNISSDLNDKILSTYNYAQHEVIKLQAKDDILSSKIDAEITNRKAADAIVKTELCTYVDNQDTKLSGSLLSDIEKLRHYEHFDISEKCPYETKDFAVNCLLNGIVPNSTLFDEDGHVFGKVTYNEDDTITLIPVLNSYYDDKIVQGKPYTLKKNDLILCLNDWYLSYSTDGKISLSKNIASYYTLSCATGEKIAGKIRNQKFAAQQLVSCTMVVNDYDKFEVFNSFGENKYGPAATTVSNDINAIVFDNETGTFLFKKNLTTKYYLPLNNVVGETKAKIYSTDIISDGTDIDEIVVTYANERVKLNRDNSFSARVLNDSYNTLSCKLEDDIAKFDVVQTLYQYIANDTTTETPTSLSIEPVPNRLLDEESLTSDISISFKQSTIHTELNEPFVLTKLTDDIWHVENVERGKLVCNIQLDRSMNLVVVDIDGTDDSGEIKLHEKFAIDTTPIVKDKVNVVDFVQVERPFTFDSTEQSQGELYTIVCGEYVDGYSETCNFESKNVDKLQFVIPDKTSDNISREALFALNFTGTKDVINVEFITKDNSVLAETTIQPDKLACLQVREINSTKFIVTDLAENEHDWKFDWLKDKLFELSNEVSSISTDINTTIDDLSTKISADVDSLSAKLSNEIDILSGNLSNEIDDLSAKLSIEVDALSGNLCAEVDSTKDSIIDIYERISGIINYKGELTLSTNYEPGDYTGIKRLFIDNGYPETDKLSANWFFIVKAVDQAHYTIDGIEVEDHDYLSINKNIIVKDITSADFNITDVMDKDVFHLCANSQTIKGKDNLFVERQLFNDISAASTAIDSANISKLDAASITAGVLSATDVDIAQLSTMSASVEKLSAKNVEIEKTSIELAETERLSSKTADIDELKIDSSMSANAKDVHLTDRLSTLDEELTYLHEKEQRYSNDIAYISAEVSANDNDIETLSNGLSTVSSDLSVLDRHYSDRAMSCDIVLEHIVDPDGGHKHISATVDKLLIVDEVTFDLYALTIRNGSLNINRVSSIADTQEYYK